MFLMAQILTLVIDLITPTRKVKFLPITIISLQQETILEKSSFSDTLASKSPLNPLFATDTLPMSPTSDGPPMITI